MKYLLAPLSWLYGLMIACRNKAFDLGLLKSVDIGVPVISVGNMTMGGTGKTPLVEYIVDVCRSKGRRVAVVSRGYGRESAGVRIVSNGKQLLTDPVQGGDEPVQISRKFPTTIVVVGERRVDAGRVAVNGLHADVIILDDGFQHRYLKRDIDIVVLDSRRSLFQIPMIPAGERREPLSALGRAHLIAFSRAYESTEWWNEQGDMSSKPAVHFDYRIDRIVHAGSNDSMPVDGMKRRKVFLFSGIGDHQAFVRRMKRAGFDVVGEMKFRDHHRYTAADLRNIREHMTQHGADVALTTEKDVVRLSGDKALVKDFAEVLYYSSVLVDITRGRETLHSMIDNCLAKRTA